MPFSTFALSWICLLRYILLTFIGTCNCCLAEEVSLYPYNCYHFQGYFTASLLHISTWNNFLPEAYTLVFKYIFVSHFITSLSLWEYLCSSLFLRELSVCHCLQWILQLFPSYGISTLLIFMADLCWFLWLMGQSTTDWELKQWQKFIFTVVETRSLTSRCQQVLVSSEASSWLASGHMNLAWYSRPYRTS